MHCRAIGEVDRDSADLTATYFSLGVCYGHGKGVKQDYAESAKWHFKAANMEEEVGRDAHGNFYSARSQTVIGNYYRSGNGVPQDYAEAVKWYRKAADKGHAAALCELAKCYAKGDGIFEDDAEAVKLFREAADNLYVDADTLLKIGVCYYIGDGIPEDYIEAVKCFRKAADQSLPQAQFFLGICYKNGHGVPKDIVTAYMWYNLASASGYEKAKKDKQLLSVDMTEKQIAEAQRLSREWKPKGDSMPW